ncbi:PH domain-containing protein [Candidatus Saccharibacteria bacterium]|nr:PH domain-containing protein [Candidatus Saccharibacteria bacterium]
MIPFDDDSKLSVYVPSPKPAKLVAKIDRAEEIDRVLKSLGADRYDLLLPETHTLASILHPDEQIIGIVYGKYRIQNNPQSGRGALVATSNRVLLIDKKPLFEKIDEMTYQVISGVTYSKVSIAGTVTLHSRVGDIAIRTLNHKCARSFLEAIEARVLKNT